MDALKRFDRLHASRFSRKHHMLAEADANDDDSSDDSDDSSDDDSDNSASNSTAEDDQAGQNSTSNNSSASNVTVPEEEEVKDEQEHYAHYQDACDTTKDPLDLTMNCWLRFTFHPVFDATGPRLLSTVSIVPSSASRCLGVICVAYPDRGYLVCTHIARLLPCPSRSDALSRNRAARIIARTSAPRRLGVRQVMPATAGHPRLSEPRTFGPRPRGDSASDFCAAGGGRRAGRGGGAASTRTRTT